MSALRGGGEAAAHNPAVELWLPIELLTAESAPTRLLFAVPAVRPNSVRSSAAMMEQNGPTPRWRRAASPGTVIGVPACTVRAVYLIITGLQISRGFGGSAPNASRQKFRCRHDTPVRQMRCRHSTKMHQRAVIRGKNLWVFTGTNTYRGKGGQMARGIPRLVFGSRGIFVAYR